MQKEKLKQQLLVLVSLSWLLFLAGCALPVTPDQSNHENEASQKTTQNKQKKDQPQKSALKNLFVSVPDITEFDQGFETWQFYPQVISGSSTPGFEIVTHDQEEAARANAAPSKYSQTWTLTRVFNLSDSDSARFDFKYHFAKPGYVCFQIRLKKQGEKYFSEILYEDTQGTDVPLEKSIALDNYLGERVSIQVYLEKAYGVIAGEPGMYIHRAGVVKEDHAHQYLIADVNLRNEIKSRLDLTGYELNLKDLQQLTDLHAEWDNIADLSGLEHCINLTRLDLNHNQISRISPLTSLTQITSLNLNGNSITDLSALTGFTQLTELYLSENPISDFSPLFGLNQIETFYFKETNIQDLTFLDTWQQLAHIYLSNNSHLNTDPGTENRVSLDALIMKGVKVDYDQHFFPDLMLRKLVKLKVGVTNRELTCADLDRLTDLYVEPYDGVNHLDHIQYCTNLESLIIYSNNVNNIDCIATLYQLKKFALYNSSLVNINALQNLTNLTELDLAENRIRDISALSGLTGLKKLELQDNRIQDISALAGLTGLEELILDHNLINNVPAFFLDMPVLKLLNISFNKIDFYHYPQYQTIVNQLKAKGVTVYSTHQNP